MTVEQAQAQRTTWISPLVADAPLYAVASALLALCLAIFATYSISVGGEAILANARLYLLAGLALLVIDSGWLLLRVRPPRPTAFLLAAYRARLLRPHVLASLPMLALVIGFMPFFSKLKSIIPLFNAYSWDATFIAWDRALFFGYDAWEALQPMLGYPAITALLALLYHAWFLLIYVGTLFMLFWPSAVPVRRQYLLAFFLCWTAIGGFLAAVFASVGPCFLEPILGDPAFAGQMAYLRAADAVAPVMTLDVQAMLLGWHQAGEGGLGSGITAMPSMHVAMATLFWLAIRRVSPLAGKAFGAFLIVIWIGSVHLAYHYAVDGLIAAIATYALWRLSLWAIARWDALAGRSAQPALRTNTVPAE